MESGEDLSPGEYRALQLFAVIVVGVRFLDFNWLLLYYLIAGLVVRYRLLSHRCMVKN